MPRTHTHVDMKAQSARWYQVQEHRILLCALCNSHAESLSLIIFRVGCGIVSVTTIQLGSVLLAGSATAITGEL